MKSSAIRSGGKTRSNKQRIRDIQRLLSRPDLPETIRDEQERILEGLKEQSSEKKRIEKERHLATKYKKIKFIERQKLSRIRDRLIKKEQQSGLTEEELLEKEEVEAKIKYIVYYPPDEKYISILKHGEGMSTESINKSMKILDALRDEPFPSENAYERMRQRHKAQRRFHSRHHVKQHRPGTNGESFTSHKENDTIAALAAREDEPEEEIYRSNSQSKIFIKKSNSIRSSAASQHKHNQLNNKSGEASTSLNSNGLGSRFNDNPQISSETLNKGETNKKMKKRSLQHAQGISDETQSILVSSESSADKSWNIAGHTNHNDSDKEEKSHNNNDDDDDDDEFFAADEQEAKRFRPYTVDEDAVRVTTAAALLTGDTKDETSRTSESCSQKKRKRKRARKKKQDIGETSD